MTKYGLSGYSWTPAGSAKASMPHGFTLFGWFGTSLFLRARLPSGLYKRARINAAASINHLARESEVFKALELGRGWFTVPRGPMVLHVALRYLDAQGWPYVSR